MRGIVQSGGTPPIHIVSEEMQGILPLANAQVTLYESAGAAPMPVGNGTTGPDGTFTITPTKTSTPGIFYAVANVSPSVLLMTLLGPEMPSEITINELTTLAATYCCAQFLDGAGIQGSTFALRIAMAMSANLVLVQSGLASPVLTSTPNEDETYTMRETYSLANLLAFCVRHPDQALQPFFELTTPPGSGNAPDNTIAAMGNLARMPSNAPGGIYKLTKFVEVYQPVLQQLPDAWTIAVKVNDSGDDAHMFAGPGSVAFDDQGRGWITNNVNQGQPTSGDFAILLDAAGHPARDGGNQKVTPLFGGGLLGGGFGVAVHKKDAWLSNFGWGKVWPTPQGSVSRFDTDDLRVLSPGNGIQNGVWRVQGIAIDPKNGNVWVAGYQSNSVAVYPGGRPENAVVYPSGTPDSDFAPFGIALAQDGTAWVTNSNASASAIVNLRFTGTAIDFVRQTNVGKTLKGIVIDSGGTIWVASGGDDHVYAFDENGTMIGGYQGGGIDGPWGITVDGDDHVWVGNFGPLEPGSVFHGRLTQLVGANLYTRPYNTRIGDGISPQSGYTVPTAGSPVLLHDKTPLYGAEGPPCFIPMMRTTGAVVDAAGNVWTCNNWKPDFDIDAGDPLTNTAGNPGGDGMMIFIGVAKPMPPPPA